MTDRPVTSETLNEALATLCEVGGIIGYKPGENIRSTARRVMARLDEALDGWEDADESGRRSIPRVDEIRAEYKLDGLPGSATILDTPPSARPLTGGTFTIGVPGGSTAIEIAGKRYEAKPGESLEVTIPSGLERALCTPEGMEAVGETIKRQMGRGPSPTHSLLQSAREAEDALNRVGIEDLRADHLPVVSAPDPGRWPSPTSTGSTSFADLLRAPAVQRMLARATVEDAVKALAWCRDLTKDLPPTPERSRRDLRDLTPREVLDRGISALRQVGRGLTPGDASAIADMLDDAFPEEE